jgi:hypothetical protein
VLSEAPGPAPGRGRRHFLAMVALFQPLRRRVQQLVDRRFTRRRYDAAQAIQAFSARLRDQVDLDTLTSELLGVVDQTMQQARRQCGSATRQCRNGPLGRSADHGLPSLRRCYLTLCPIDLNVARVLRAGGELVLSRLCGGRWTYEFPQSHTMGLAVVC